MRMTLWLIGSLFSLHLSAQPLSPPSWKIGLGYGQVTTLDQHSSPLQYQAQAGKLSLQYQHWSEQKQWGLTANLLVGSKQSSRHGQRQAYVVDPVGFDGKQDSFLYVLNPGLSYIQAELGYQQMYRIYQGPAEIWLGGQVQDRYQFAGIGADTWFFNQLSISPKLSLMTQQSWGRVEANVSLPLISYVLRKPYANDPSLPMDSYFLAYLKTGSQLATWNRLREVSADLSYARSLSARTEIGIQYSYLARSHQPEGFRPHGMTTHQVQLFYSF